MVNLPTYCTPYDIGMRVHRRHPYWVHGTPDIQLTGKEGEFGSLVFNFGNNVVSFRVFILSVQAILASAHMAIANIADIAIMREQSIDYAERFFTEESDD